MSFTVGIWVFDSWQVSPSPQDGLHKPIPSAALHCLPQEFLNPCESREKVFYNRADVLYWLLSGVTESSLGSQAAQRKSFKFLRPHQWTKAHDHSFSSAAKRFKTFEVEERAQCQDIWLCTRRWEIHPAQCPGTEGHTSVIDNGEVRTWTSTGKTSSREGANWKQKPEPLMPQAAWLQAVSLQILGWKKITHLCFAREGANPPGVLKRNLSERKVRQGRVILHCKFRWQLY